MLTGDMPLSPDILSPRAGASIRPRQMGDGRDLMTQSMLSARRYRRSIIAAALMLAALGLLSARAFAAETAAQTRDADAKPREADAKARDAIEVQGNRRIDADTVRSYFHAAPDGRFDDATRDAALKALLATGLFDDVTIQRAGERLVVHLHEAPVPGPVAFEGNKKIQDK